MKAFDLVGTIHGREYSDHGEYVTADDYYHLQLYSEAVDRLKLRLEEENAVLRKAAERYWWVREQSRNESGIRIAHPFGNGTGFRNQIDAAVDEDMDK
jgi:hypothetical protein